MAKKTAMNEVDSGSTNEEPKLNVPVPLLDESAWDDTEGEEYGGESTILEMDVGQVAGPFISTGCRKGVNLGNDMPPVDMHEAKSVDGANFRLPICASFSKVAEQSRLDRGDTFIVKRLNDQKKKNGKGKGNMMEMWAIIITERAPEVLQQNTA